MHHYQQQQVAASSGAKKSKSQFAVPAIAGLGDGLSAAPAAAAAAAAAGNRSVAQTPVGAVFTQTLSLCNAIESKHSNGYPQVLQRGDVFGSYTDMRAPTISLTVLPPPRSVFAGPSSCPLSVRWQMVSSIQDAQQSAAAAVRGAQTSLSSPTSSSTTNSNVGSPAPSLWNGGAAAPSSLSIPNEFISSVKSCNDLLTQLHVSVAATTAPSDAPPPLVGESPRVLVAVTSFQHTSVYITPIEPAEVAAAQTPSSSACAADLIQTWTMPSAGKRCTAQLLTIAGAVSVATSPTDSDVTVFCEPLLILGFERGDVYFASASSERVLRRINASSSTSKPPEREQLIPAACSSIAEVRSSAQSSLRQLYLSRQSAAATTATGGGGDASMTKSAAESIYALGFDNGAILVCTIVLSDSSSSGGGGPPPAVSLRHHINFGARPIHAMEPSMPPFFLQLWLSHDAQRQRKSSASLLTMSSSSSSTSGTAATGTSRRGGGGEDVLQAAAENRTEITTVLPLLSLFYGAIIDDDAEAASCPSYAAVTSEGGAIHLVQLPSFDKRICVSNRTEGCACGDFLTVKWLSRSGNMMFPDMLIAGGEGDELDVFVLGNLHQGQFRRLVPPSTAWGDGGSTTTDVPNSGLASHAGHSTLSMRLSQRLQQHRSWINSLSVLYVASPHASPESACLAQAAYVAAASLDDTVSFWHVPLQHQDSSSHANPGHHLTPVREPAKGSVPISSSSHQTSATPLRRPPPLHPPAADGLVPSSPPAESAALSPEPAHVVHRCHDDLVVATASCCLGVFGTVWVTSCLRGRVKFWSVAGVSSSGTAGAPPAGTPR